MIYLWATGALAALYVAVLVPLVAVPVAVSLGRPDRLWQPPRWVDRLGVEILSWGNAVWLLVMALLIVADLA